MTVSKRKLVRAFAYVIEASLAKNFLVLGKYGYETRIKQLQISGRPRKAWDVGLSIDVVRLCHFLMW